MKRVVAALMAFAVPAAAWAAGEKRLTVDEAVRLALESSRTLHIAESAAESARARQGEVAAADRPHLQTLASYTKLSDVGPFQIQPPGSPAPVTVSPSITNSYLLRLSAAKPLWNGGLIAGRIASAGYYAEAAGAEARRERAEVVANATGAYWGLYKAIEVKKAFQDNVRRVQAHLGDVTNLVEAGVALRDEQLKVQVQLSNAKFQLMDAENNVRLAAMALNSAMGLPLEGGITPATPARTEPSALPPLEEFRNRAFESRPELAAARLRISAASSAYDATRALSMPQLSLFGNVYMANPNQRYLPNREQFDTTWDFGVMLSYDLWDGGAAREQAGQAASAREQARWTEEHLRDGIELEVNQCYMNLSQARDRIALAREGVGQALESARIVKNRFTNGHATSTDVLDAENALLQAEINLTVALADYEIARVRMDKAAGVADAAPR